MPIKFVCTDKIPLPQGQIRNKPGICFKTGLKAGFAAGISAGIKKGTKRGTKIGARIANEQGVKRARIVRAIPQAALQMQVKRGVRRARETVARRADLAVQQRENAQMEMNDVNIQPAAPRVRPAGRRDRFNAYYNINQPPAVAPLISIKAYVDTEKARGRKNRVDVIATDLVPRVRPDLGGGARIKRLYNKAQMIQLLLDSGLYERGGER